MTTFLISKLQEDPLKSAHIPQLFQEVDRHCLFARTVSDFYTECHSEVKLFMEKIEKISQKYKMREIDEFKGYMNTNLVFHYLSTGSQHMARYHRRYTQSMYK